MHLIINCIVHTLRNLSVREAIYISLYSGGWDTEGVTVVTIDMENTIITCNSTHLTSFAVLVDVSESHQV